MVTPLKNKIAIWFDFNKSLIIKGFLGSLALLSPIVFTAIGIESKLFFSLLAVIALSGFFILNKKELFWFGAFSGVLWFYWVSFSLYYYNLLWLAPLLLAFIFFYYGALFWLVGFLSQKFFWLRIVIVAFIFDYLAPLGFDWLRPEIIYSGSLFGPSKWELLALLLGVAVLVKAKKFYKLAAVPALLFAVSLESTKPKELPKLNIKLIETSIEQDDKWDEKFKLQLTAQNLNLIDKAIAENADIVVLPETAFPYFLNKADGVTELLKQKSFDAAILAGGLKLDGNTIYNSSYLFKNGEMFIFDKVVAVPFGEVNPLPKFMSQIVNDLFFNGAEDYKTAEKPSDFEVGGVTFRNAICYEATSEKMYEGQPKYMIAISNNAWFVPSLEPVIQEMIIRHLSKKYGTIVFHSVNKSRTSIIN